MSSPHPRLSTQTLRRIASVICGLTREDRLISPYRRQTDLDDFFAHDLRLDSSDVGGTSRGTTTEAWLKKYNGTTELVRIIEAAVRPADYVDSEASVENAVAFLNDVLAPDDLRLAAYGKGYRLIGTADVALPESTIGDVLSDEYITELSDKCTLKLAAGDLDGAITNARTLLEAVLAALEERLTGTRGDYKGDLPKQFKQVAKLLRMDDERPDLDDRFKDVIRGLVMIANGLAPLRNKMSDGHARERRPAPHHARVIVNAAKTVATFLVESYAFQRDKGLLTASPPGARAAVR